MVETKVPSVTPSPNETVNVTITSIKLKGSYNYLLWAQAVKIYIMAKKKLKFLNSDPPAPDASGYEDWMLENVVSLIWLWNSMEPEIATNVMFHNTAKGVWDDLQDTYSQGKNMNRVYDLYDKMFHIHQSGKPLYDYYSTFKGLAEELIRHM
ncbi:UBN2_3 domain-containing protein [Cephalotus follicularis]|uniref:UBN2_3 domain-containing protein n=1 Tax=Cephalotus follicularis TaxID=3775 RepID=A0A1Q3AU69_CEPFO|nr:UBN2_3 domain-containing protein [Cephalotus follicularis]